MSIIIIAEAGINHNGCMDTAKKLIEAAHEAGADYVKFQSYFPEKQHVKSSPRYELSKQWHLSFDQQAELKRYCDEVGIEFLSTPFDTESVDFLCDLGVDYLKIASGEIVNMPLIEHIAIKGIPIIMSTGMAGEDEIECAVHRIKEITRRSPILLHCVSLYPVPHALLNLRRICWLNDRFGCQVGFSDHSLGYLASVAAVALGARVIEKHITLDCDMEGPDHGASLEARHWGEFVKAVRLTPAMTPVAVRTSLDDLETTKIARKSIVASRDIGEGERFTSGNLTAKKPGTGIYPTELPGVYGRIAACDILADTIVTWAMVE